MGGAALLIYYKDFDNRYPDWVPVSYELRRENPLETTGSKYAGLPNENNTKAWDDLIMRLCSIRTI